MDLHLNLYDVYELLNGSYKNIDFRSAIYKLDQGWRRILSIIRFSNETETAIKENYNRLDLDNYKTKNFKIQHEVFEISEWEKKLIDLYQEIHEDIEIYDIDEFLFDDKKYQEYQSSFLDEFKINYSIPSRWFFFTEEEVKNHNLINFYYNVPNKNEHHNLFNRFLNAEIKEIGEDNIYNVINRTLQLSDYNSQTTLFISIVFPIYFKINDLNYDQDILSGKVHFHEIFEKTRIFFRIYANPNYNDKSLKGREEFSVLKTSPNTREIDKGFFVNYFSLDFKRYDCDPIFEIRARWDELPNLFLIDIQKTFGIPRFQKLYEGLREELIEHNEYIFELPQNKKSLPNYEKKFIKTDFRDYQLKEYDEFIELINISAYNDKFYRILPVLLRTLFENLLYDIFQTSLNSKHKNFFFLKEQNRARDFSQLIALLNILKDKDFKLFHKNSINQNTISELKEIQNFGNWTVHQFLRLVDRDFAEKWEDKVNRILKALLVLYKRIKDQTFEITAQSTLDNIKRTLNLKISTKKKF